MPSGKKSRQQRQQAAPPPVRSKGAGGGLGGARQASPRALAIGGGVLALIVVVIVLIVVLTNGSSSGSANGDAIKINLVNAPATGNASTSSMLNAKDVAKLLDGIPQNGLTLGSPTAPVTLVEWIDLQCPVCDQFETTEFSNLVTKFVKPGNLKIELKPWNIIDANDGTVDSYRGQEAVIAASKQNKAFNFAAVLYFNQQSEGTNWLTDGVISSIAGSVDGLNTQQWVTDANSKATQDTITQIDAAAQAHSFNATPTFQLGTSDATLKYYGNGWGQPPTDAPSLEAAISNLIKK
jgi:protein-disulfide isomerase